MREAGRKTENRQIDRGPCSPMASKSWLEKVRVGKLDETQKLDRQAGE